MRVIFETDDKRFRIIEHPDTDYSFENLCGDTYNPDVVKDFTPETLLHKKEAFRREVLNVGVYGYVLERWNPTPGTGYEHVDSCWGFVGQYDANVGKYNHYIVDEMKLTIESLTQNKA